MPKANPKSGHPLLDAYCNTNLVFGLNYACVMWNSHILSIIVLFCKIKIILSSYIRNVLERINNLRMKVLQILRPVIYITNYTYVIMILL